MIHTRKFDAVDAIVNEARTATRWGRIGDISLFVDDLIREVESKCGPMPKTGIRRSPNRPALN